MDAGYSGTPLLKKLGIKNASRIRLIGAPSTFIEWLSSQQVEINYAGSTEIADLIVLFVEWKAQLVELLPSTIEGLAKQGGLWIAWPKKASKVPTDIVENALRDLILPTGLVDNKVCAIDDKWSGLRFVWRLERR